MGGGGGGKGLQTSAPATHQRTAAVRLPHRPPVSQEVIVITIIIDRFHIAVAAGMVPAVTRTPELLDRLTDRLID